jgi:hypothetical protein
MRKPRPWSSKFRKNTGRSSIERAGSPPAQPHIAFFFFFLCTTFLCSAALCTAA